MVLHCARLITPTGSEWGRTQGALVDRAGRGELVEVEGLVVSTNVLLYHFRVIQRHHQYFQSFFQRGWGGFSVFSSLISCTVETVTGVYPLGKAVVYAQDCVERTQPTQAYIWTIYRLKKSLPPLLLGLVRGPCQRQKNSRFGVIFLQNRTQNRPKSTMEVAGRRTGSF